MYWVTAFLGVVSIAAPFLLGYSENQTAMLTSVLVGFVLTGASLFEWAAEGVQKWEYWVLGIAGLASAMAPMLIGFELMSISSLTMVITGFTAIGIAGVKLFPGRSHY